VEKAVSPAIVKEFEKDPRRRMPRCGAPGSAKLLKSLGEFPDLDFHPKKLLLREFIGGEFTSISFLRNFLFFLF